MEQRTRRRMSALRLVRWVKFEKSGHLPFWEEKEAYLQTVTDFLKS